MGHCILTVDDSSTMRQMITFTLKGANFEVLEAGDGVEALEAYQREQNSIGVILMDATMPRMTGPEAFKAILVGQTEIEDNDVGVTKHGFRHR